MLLSNVRTVHNAGNFICKYNLTVLTVNEILL